VTGTAAIERPKAPSTPAGADLHATPHEVGYGHGV
jgi:hypothetical protein